MTDHPGVRHDGGPKGGRSAEDWVLRAGCSGPFIQPNQPERPDQRDRPDYRPWRGRNMCLNTYSATRRPCAMPSVLSKAQWIPR